MRHIIYGSHWESVHEHFLLCRKPDRTFDAHIGRHRADRSVHGHAQQTAGVWPGLGAERYGGTAADGGAPVKGIFCGKAAQVRVAAVHAGHRISATRMARADRDTLWRYLELWTARETHRQSQCLACRGA